MATFNSPLGREDAGSSNLIAVISDLQSIDDQSRYTAERIPIDTIARVSGMTPVILPARTGADYSPLLDCIGGLFMPGGLTNVHPSRYHRPASEDDGPFDHARDSVALPIIREALNRDIPLLATCRGFHELNVALGGTLRREPDKLPEEEKHGTPESAKNENERFRIRQTIKVRTGGALHSLIGADVARVNSCHSFLIDDLAPGLRAEATALDGTVEAATVAGASFAMGVVFHPEYWAEHDDASLGILLGFVNAVKARTRRERPSERDASISLWH